jgi:outer membrane protein assembly factor BamB
MLTAAAVAALLAPPPAVVPIFVNAGAALIPTLIAAASSFVAILLKPRELAALVRRRPWVPAIAVLVGLGIWLAVSIWTGGNAQAGSSRGAASATAAAGYQKTDWTAKALELIQAEANATKTTGVVPMWAYLPEQSDVTQWVLSSPVYADKSNRLFCTATVTDVGSLFGLLYCVDADTGKRVWQVEKAGDEDLKPFFSSPALSADQKSLIVGQGLHEDENCALICLNADTGELRWRAPTPLHIESSPAVLGDMAVVGCGAIEGPDRKPKSHAGFVLAVSVSDGKELWRYDLADPESSPAIGEDGTVYIGSGFNGNAVVALRPGPDAELAAKGLKREFWRAQARYPITGPVTLTADLVIVGGGNSDFVYADPNPAGVVMAIDRNTGAIRWQTPMEDAVLNRIAVHGGRAFCPVRNGQVVALDLASGKPVWKQAVSGKSPILAGTAVTPDGRTVFAASKDGNLALLDAATGRPTDRHPLNRKEKPGDEGYSFSTPTWANERLFIGSETGGLRAFRPARAQTKSASN